MFKVDTDGRNKYVDQGLTLAECLAIAGDWEDKQREPVVMSWANQDGVVHYTWSDHLVPGGTKARWGDLLFKRWTDAGIREFVYVAPRQGYAAIALAYLADRYGVRLTLFMPAAKEVSDHQALAIELGAVPIFKRVAAMPNLNRIAAAYAETVERARFVPFGMDHKLVVAAGVASTYRMCADPSLLFNVDQVASVVSTGVLTRTLQIAWPEVEFAGLAVGRNMHDGECGNATMLSYDKPFLSPSRLKKTPVPGVTSERCYDMKGFEVVTEWNRSTLFWNVAGEAPKPRIDKTLIRSYREWGE